MLQIDKNIPIPPPNRGRGPASRWAEFQVGDSAFIAADGSYAQTVRSSVCQHSRRHGVRFSVRTCTENNVAGVRVWRIE